MDEYTSHLSAGACSAAAPELLIKLPFTVDNTSGLAPPVTLKEEAGRITISESAVVPLFLIDIVCASMLLKVIFPLSEFVLPAPSLNSILTFPLPASIIVPASIVISALPGSLSESTTPLARVSFAISVKSPSFVVILSLIKMLLPA